MLITPKEPSKDHPPQATAVASPDPQRATIELVSAPRPEATIDLSSASFMRFRESLFGVSVATEKVLMVALL